MILSIASIALTRLNLGPPSVCSRDYPSLRPLAELVVITALHFISFPDSNLQQKSQQQSNNNIDNMFRRTATSLPLDPKYPTNLKDLNYFINEKDQIRKIAYPDQRFCFQISDNDRYNEVHKEAFHSKLIQYPK